MHLRRHQCILPLILYFISALFAAPTSTSTHNHTHVPLPTLSTYHPILVSFTQTHTTHSLTESLPHFTTHVQTFPHPPYVQTHTRDPPTPAPTRTRAPDIRPQSQSIRQTPIIIFFEVLCGIFLLIVCMGMFRFCRSYRKTPTRDRVSAIISRHRLQMELDELRRRPPMRRFNSIQEPAPPYMPRPPSYIETPPANTRVTQANYDVLSNASPPGSPTRSHNSLDISQPLFPAPSHILPNG